MSTVYSTISFWSISSCLQTAAGGVTHPMKFSIDMCNQLTVSHQR